MKSLSILLLASAFALAAPLQAADKDRDRMQTRDPSTHATPSPDQEGPQVYGWELMSGKERMQYRFKMMSLDTEKERAAFQREHHKKMRERAKAQGKSLPDMPYGGGWGVGKGPGVAAPAMSQTQERAYGWELMTEKERREYHERMRSQSTEKDREAFRAEHHRKMQERAYGWELMTEKERNEYHERMRSQRTEKDREALRAEHHRKMQERAKAQGKSLPGMPPEQRGPSNPPWMGQGQGKGQGAGKP